MLSKQEINPRKKQRTLQPLIQAEIEIGLDNFISYGPCLLGPIAHWLTSISEDAFPLTCFAKTRYRQTEQACMISPIDDDHQHVVMFSNPQRAMTPGQYIVFYDKNRCLGGAVIESVIR